MSQNHRSAFHIDFSERLACVEHDRARAEAEERFSDAAALHLAAAVLEQLIAERRATPELVSVIR
jgi:hypothetical protein